MAGVASLVDQVLEELGHVDFLMELGGLAARSLLERLGECRAMREVCTRIEVLLVGLIAPRSRPQVP